jgi:hypothetical protein
MPVRELLARVGSDELTEWMAFYQLEPFGEMRADLRSGVVAVDLCQRPSNQGRQGIHT